MAAARVSTLLSRSRVSRVPCKVTAIRPYQENSCLAQASEINCHAESRLAVPAIDDAAAVSVQETTSEASIGE